jgi:tetratricopeptide (TPR) repeat protein
MKILNNSDTKEMRGLRPVRQLDTARRLERSGDYEGARNSLVGIWSGVGKRPAVEMLSADLQAEALLRAGSLSGWIGTARQLGGAQEFAKDLISEAVRCFESLGNTEKTAEAQTDLAICYWRSGALDEGRVLFQQALKLARDPENRLRVLVNSSAVEISCGQLDRAIYFLDEAAPLVESVTDRGATGRYYLQRALVYKKLGGPANLDRALIEYSAASLDLNEAGEPDMLPRLRTM